MPDYKEFEEDSLDEKQLIEFMQDNNESTSVQNRYKGMNTLMANLPYIYDSIVAGKSINHICKYLGVARGSWYQLKERSYNFTKLLDMAQQEQIDNIKGSLVNKAQDKYVTAEKVLPNGMVVQYQKYVPADFNAIKFYLLNKASDEYQEKQTVEVKKQEIIIDIFDDEVSES